MGTFSYPIDIGDPAGEQFERIDALVDTGATYTMVPGSVLQRLGVAPHVRDRFELADGRVVERDVGQTWAMIDGKRVITLVVFGGEDAGAVLGAYTLEGLLLAVDPAGQRLLPQIGLLKGAILRTLPSANEASSRASIG